MQILSKVFKFIKSIKARKSNYDVELERLKKLPRYVSGSSSMLDFEMKFVDACTFIGGSDEIFFKNIYEFQADKEDPYIVDCGANIGLSVIYFKKLYPKSKVVAFEPDPNIFNVLKENIDFLGLKHVILHQKAIWINNEGIEFNVEGGFSGRIPKSPEEQNIIKVETQSLKELINQDVDFLKIDIEGAENEVIFNIEERLHFVKNIFIEFHSYIDDEQKLGEILTLLKNNNFRYSIHEAYVNSKPYVEKETMLGMDLQVNIYGFRK
jgi:FkbM family methyltransferase